MVNDPSKSLIYIHEEIDVTTYAKEVLSITPSWLIKELTPNTERRDKDIDRNNDAC